MLAVISPAKKLNFDPVSAQLAATQPQFMEEAIDLAKQAKTLKPVDLQRLMGISEKLADLNYQRFQSFSAPFNRDNSKQAALAFDGDTYVGLNAPSLAPKDLEFAQSHLAILSGLYGLLRPLDLMQPYRLEMGTAFTNARGRDLYSFWGSRLTERVNEMTSSHTDRTLVNLASNEYFKAIRPKELDGPLLTPVFKEIKDGKSRTISFMAKQARGMMARFLVEHQIERPDDLKQFNSGGYQFQPAESNDKTWVFSRLQPPPKG